MFANRVGDGTLHAGVCTGSEEIDKAGAEIAFLRAWRKLPHPEPKTRSIMVSVKWWDGAPVTNAVVDCGTNSPDPCAGGQSATAYVDTKGHASCTVPAGLPVTIAAQALWEAGDNYKVNIDPVVAKLSASNGPVNVELILKKSKDRRGKLKPAVLPSSLPF
jgi:hypothetical protein